MVMTAVVADTTLAGDQVATTSPHSIFGTI